MILESSWTKEAVKKRRVENISQLKKKMPFFSPSYFVTALPNACRCNTLLTMEIQIVYRLFQVKCYLLHVPRLPSQPGSPILKAVEGLSTLYWNSISVHDLLPKWMIFFHLASWWSSDLYITKNCVFCWCDRN